ncbi:nucleotidyltransferase domain-containing protein [Microbacterium sp. A8/3-1]|uniref:Nucleotidyltransferase domain-containing protein n=1 Tax=Microbacterium sp. A8/3-1 TaxID=3160749 RepID=A0AAU7VZS4_9MICO
MIKTARERTGLTQSALANRSGIRQSVISEYESGRREPSVAALDRLLGAAGLTLTLAEAPETLRQVRLLAADLRTILAEYGATNIEVFGSVARGDDHENSDIDLLVDFAPDVGMFDLLRMQSAAEALLGRPVDIVPRASLKSGVADDVRRDAVPL